MQMKYRSNYFTAVRCAGVIVFAASALCQFRGPCMAASKMHMPPGAYLARPSLSVAELAEQVRTNSIVSQRYARLFHMSPGRVSTEFARLRLTRLTSER